MPFTILSDISVFSLFLDDSFRYKHPEIPDEKKSDSPDEDKSIGDSTSLKPILSDFFALHPHFKPDTFLGDSAFDTIDTYGFLKDEFHFSKVLIPYNPRNESSLDKVGYNSYSYPICPKDSSLDMKYLGLCHEKGRADRYKFNMYIAGRRTRNHATTKAEVFLVSVFSVAGKRRKHLTITYITCVS